MPVSIRDAKRLVAENGGLRQGESLADALDRLPAPEVLAEQSRMQSVRQAGRTCHPCSCHIAPPCSECVECPTCNEEP